MDKHVGTVLTVLIFALIMLFPDQALQCAQRFLIILFWVWLVIAIGILIAFLIKKGKELFQ